MDWLNALYLKIEAQKIEIEQTTRSLQSLFQSWPTQEQEPKLDDGSKERVKGQGQDGDIVCTVNLTEEEKEGVNLVDKLLLKAQKARQVQQKLEEPKRSVLRKDVQSRLSSSTNKDTVPAEMKESTRNGLIKVDTITKDKIKEGSRSHSALDRDEKGKVSTTNQNSKLVKDSRQERSTKHVYNPGAPTNQSKRITVTEKSLKPVCKSSFKDQRTSSGPPGKRVAPAHVSAPFQTNPRLVNSKLKTEYRSSTGRVLSAVKNSKNQSVKGKGTYSAPVQRPSSQCGVKSQTNTSKFTASKVCTSVARDNSCNIDGPHMDTEFQSLSIDSCKHSDTSETDHGGEKLSALSTDHNKADKPVENSEKTEISDDLEEMQVQDDAGFKLVKDGHSLSIPQKYKKLAGMNRKLRQKLFTQKVTTKVDSPQPNIQFPLQLQQTFEDPVTIQLQMATKQAAYLVNVYKNLGDLLESLKLQTLDGDSTIESVLMAKKSLEYILTKFHETELQLHSADLGILMSMPESPRFCKQTIHEPVSNSSVVWNYVTHLGSSHTRLLKYRSFKQLERYTSLLHRLQLVQFQIEAMDKMAEQTLPVLNSLDITSSDFIQVLRCSYSMLSTNPNRVPVIVRDTIQDETENQETDIT